MAKNFEIIEKVKKLNIFIKPDMKKSNIFGQLFQNPLSFKTWDASNVTFSRFVKFRLLHKLEFKVPPKEQLDIDLPVLKPKFEDNSATWLGHATVFTKLNGVSIITDPVWSERASVCSFFGPKRYRPSPCRIEELPKLDLILISHDHYDHLDKNFIKQINKIHKDITYVVGLNMKSILKSYGVDESNIIALDWDEKIEIKINRKLIKISCIPAQHWSGRTVIDFYKRLWCGLVVEIEDKSLFYTGDTGFCKEEFEKVGKNFNIDLGIIPIGCYKPEFLIGLHISPIEALEIHKLIKANKSIAVHWGTYDMGSNDLYLEPKKFLLSIRKDAKFYALHHGETLNLLND